VTKKIVYPKGFPYGKDRIKIAISFPADFFKDIIKMAKQEKKEFNAMVIELCRVGKLDLEESDRYEPIDPQERILGNSDRSHIT
jgi:hypothetical protein